MQYKIKAGDTLAKIAKQFSVSVELILAFNPSITNPNKIFPNQLIQIPNVEDVPTENLSVSFTAGNAIISRAASAINKGIRYKLGAGGMNPKAALPSAANKCDCSGFVCWALGLSRQTTIPFYTRHGGWIYTDSMVADINNQSGIFEKVNTPEVGCIVVYGAGAEIGHVGLVSKVSNGVMQKVIHCSSGNDRRTGDSIQETDPGVFNRAETVWGKFIG